MPQHHAVKINSVTIQSIECIDNGTPGLMTDNKLRFYAMVINTNALLSTYNVTVNGGTTITPNTNVPYGFTQFTLGPGSAGGGATFTVTVTDSLTPGCTQTFKLLIRAHVSLRHNVQHRIWKRDHTSEWELI